MTPAREPMRREQPPKQKSLLASVVSGAVKLVLPSILRGLGEDLAGAYHAARREQAENVSTGGNNVPGCTPQQSGFQP